MSTVDEEFLHNHAEKKELALFLEGFQRFSAAEVCDFSQVTVSVFN